MRFWTLDDVVDGKCSVEDIGTVCHEPEPNAPEPIQVRVAPTRTSKRPKERRQEALQVAMELHDRALAEAKAGSGSTAALVSALRKSIELESVLSTPEPGTPNAYVFVRPDWISPNRLSYRNANSKDDTVTDVVPLPEPEPEPEPVDAIAAWKAAEPRMHNAGQSIFD